MAKVPYQYRMGGVLWKRWLGEGRIGVIHNEGFQLTQVERGWRLVRRKTAEAWQGRLILDLVQQAWIDLHSETFDVEAPPPAIMDLCHDCHSS